ncbi:hypothetical protein ILYODFUR_007054 [Ilyodon furcidens]|uniref:Uncharacterized protein n=1 Tax=Ilyodon furcidens TaxID=33524 RepID=A0ABV0SJ65_9TELE
MLPLSKHFNVDSSRATSVNPNKCASRLQTTTFQPDVKACCDKHQSEPEGVMEVVETTTTYWPVQELVTMETLDAG